MLRFDPPMLTVDMLKFAKGLFILIKGVKSIDLDILALEAQMNDLVSVPSIGPSASDSQILF
jgi:hypothetical protein